MRWDDFAAADPKIGGDRVRRMKVPRGWLYQVEHHAFVAPVDNGPGHWIYGWHAPVFVPDGVP